MIVVLMGVSGCGKTTVGRVLARRLGWSFYEGDEFHPAANIEKMSKGIALTDADRLPWLAEIKKTIDECLERGLDAVIACSALRKRYRRILSDNVAELQFVYLQGDYSTIRERMIARKDHYMKPGMLESQFDSLEEPDNAIVVDISRSPKFIALQIEKVIAVIAGVKR